MLNKTINLFPACDRHVCYITTTGRSSFDMIMQRSCVATIHLPVTQHLQPYKGTSKMI